MSQMGLVNPMIYGCKICAGIDCGGVQIRVENDHNYYFWFGYDQKSQGYDRLLYRFDRCEYDFAFSTYLKKWQKARIRKAECHELIRFPVVT